MKIRIKYYRNTNYPTTEYFTNYDEANKKREQLLASLPAGYIVELKEIKE